MPVMADRIFLRWMMQSRSPCSCKNSAVWNPSGRFWWVVSRTNAGTGEADHALGLRDDEVAERGEARGDVPPVVGLVSTEM